MSLPETVEEIYEAERENLYFYLLYLGVPAAQAQELTQEAFLKLYLKMKDGATIHNVRAWLYRVAYHLAARHYKREPVFDELSPDFSLASEEPNPEALMIDQQRAKALARIIRELSPQQRNCLYLRGQGLRYREIGEVIGVRTSTVSEFLRRAIVRLKEAFDG